MEKGNVNRVIVDGRLRLNFWGKLTHYGIVIYFLAIPVVCTWFLIRSWTGAERVARPIADYLVFGLVGAIISGSFFLLQRKRLMFKTIPVHLAHEEIEGIVLQIGH